MSRVSSVSSVRTFFVVSCITGNSTCILPAEQFSSLSVLQSLKSARFFLRAKFFEVKNSSKTNFFEIHFDLYVLLRFGTPGKRASVLVFSEERAAAQSFSSATFRFRGPYLKSQDLMRYCSEVTLSTLSRLSSKTTQGSYPISQDPMEYCSVVIWSFDRFSW